MAIRVIIAEQQPWASRALVEALSLDRSIDVIEQSRNGIDALYLIHYLQPDIAILDVSCLNYRGLN